MRFLLAILLLLLAAPAWAQQGQGMSQAVVVSSCGSGALPSGALNQLTMDTTGRLCLGGTFGRHFSLERHRRCHQWHDAFQWRFDGDGVGRLGGNRYVVV